MVKKQDITLNSRTMVSSPSSTRIPICSSSPATVAPSTWATSCFVARSEEATLSTLESQDTKLLGGGSVSNDEVYVNSYLPEKLGAITRSLDLDIASVASTWRTVGGEAR